MAFSSSANFFNLLRSNSSGGFDTLRMPILNAILQTLNDGGFITLSTSATAPNTNQNTTVWLQLQAAGAGPGTPFLWNGSAWVTPTVALLSRMLFFALLGAGFNPTQIFNTYTTGAFSLAANFYDAVFSNDLSSGAVALTLPAPQNGMKYRFLKTVGNAFTISPPAGVTINYGGTLTSSGGILTLVNIGACVEIRAQNGLYYVTDAAGQVTLA